MFARKLGSGLVGRVARSSFFVARRGINTRECSVGNMFSGLRDFEFETKVSSISVLDTGCLRLQKAIEKGNAEHSVFWDENCPLYLLGLMRGGKISFYEGVSVYQHLLGLMHFTNLQPVRDEDDALKINCDYEVLRLVVAGQLTWLAKDYLHMVVSGFERFGFVIDYNNLCEFVLGLPPAEQWLLKFSYRSADFKFVRQGYDLMMNILSNTVPFLAPLQFGICYLPGLGVINYLFSKMSAEPVRLQPMFGCVGDAVFHELHRNNMHPGGLYHPLVATNQLSAHGLAVGPVGLFVHDLAHMFWINLFTPRELRHIYEVVVPEIDELIGQAGSIDYSYTKGLLEDAKNRLADFDLHLNIEEYFAGESRLVRYLGRFEQVLGDAREVLGVKGDGVGLARLRV